MFSQDAEIKNLLQKSKKEGNFQHTRFLASRTTAAILMINSQGMVVLGQVAG